MVGSIDTRVNTYERLTHREETPKQVQPHKFSAYTMKILAVVEKLLGYLNVSEGAASARAAADEEHRQQLRHGA
jgi:hypothetical protein